MQAFLVTVVRGKKHRFVRCRAFRTQHATLAAARRNPDWVVLNVSAIGPCSGGVWFRAKTYRHGNSQRSISVKDIRVMPQITAIKLIPKPDVAYQILAELARRNKLRLDACLPPLDVDTEFSRVLHLNAVDDYRCHLAPYLRAALDQTDPTGGMMSTLRRYQLAHHDAQHRLYVAEGLLPPTRQ